MDFENLNFDNLAINRPSRPATVHVHGHSKVLEVLRSIKLASAGKYHREELEFTSGYRSAFTFFANHTAQIAEASL